MSVLSIVQDACDRLSLTRPAKVFASTDLAVRQLLGLLMEVAEELSKRGEGRSFDGMNAESAFLAVNQELQTNTPIPADLRRFIPGTFFDRTIQRQLGGPLTPQQYQQWKAQPSALCGIITWRERSGQFMINPSPAAGDVIAYEYVSTFWAKNDAGAAKRRYTADDDLTFLDEELLTLGLKAAWNQAKGLDYGEDMNTYERAVTQALGFDAGRQVIYMGGPSPAPALIGPQNIPLNIPIPSG